MSSLSPDDQWFQTVLDASERDASARYLRSDWLAERGDDFCLGLAWLCRFSVIPQDYKSSSTWDWNDADAFDRLTGAIPHPIFIRLDGGRLASTFHYREYPDRASAEDALCRAYLLLDIPVPDPDPDLESY